MVNGVQLYSTISPRCLPVCNESRWSGGGSQGAAGSLRERRRLGFVPGPGEARDRDHLEARLGQASVRTGSSRRSNLAWQREDRLELPPAACLRFSPIMLAAPARGPPGLQPIGDRGFQTRLIDGVRRGRVGCAARSMRTKGCRVSTASCTRWNGSSHDQGDVYHRRRQHIHNIAPICDL